MGKKGFPEVLAHIDAHGPLYYNDILEFALRERLVMSRASIPALVNGLYELRLVDRKEITSARPMRTQYTISKKGKSVLHLLKQLEKETE